MQPSPLPGGAVPARSGDPATPVRDAVRRLHALDPAFSRRLEAVATALARVACSDREVTEAERATMEEVVARTADLPLELAVLLVELAACRCLTGDCSGSYRLSRELRLGAGLDERMRLLADLLEVAAADGAVSAEERAELRQLAVELGLDPAAAGHGRPLS